MKKFLAIVMCLAMALSMMTVVSFAADIQIGAESVTAAPGEVVEIPVNINNTTDFGMVSIIMYVPENVDFEVVPGSVSTTDTTIVGNKITLYNDSGAITLSSPICTLKVTAPAEAGTYDFTFDAYDSMVFDADFMDLPADFNDFTLTVEEAVVEPEATIIDVVPVEEEDNAVIKVLAVVGNPTEFGIKYVGDNTEYNGVTFKSLAKLNPDSTTNKAAVKVIGLDDAFEAYAN